MVEGAGFSFLVDTGTRYNMLDKCFMEFIHWEPPAEEQIRNYYCKKPAYAEVGSKRIVCRDGVRRICKMVKLDFEVEGENYSEVFYIDPCLCDYFQINKRKIAVGVLGCEFLQKHKLIVDCSRMKLHQI